MAREIIRAGHISVQQQYVLRCDRCGAQEVVLGNLLDELTTRLLAFHDAHRSCICFADCLADRSGR